MHVNPGFFDQQITPQKRAHVMVTQAAFIYSMKHTQLKRRPCLELARVDPNEAIKNTGSYGFFVMNSRNNR